MPMCVYQLLLWVSNLDGLSWELICWCFLQNLKQQLNFVDTIEMTCPRKPSWGFSLLIHSSIRFRRYTRQIWAPKFNQSMEVFVLIMMFYWKELPKHNQKIHCNFSESCASINLSLIDWLSGRNLQVANI